MEAPISASQGPMRSLPRKLDLLLSGSNYGLRAPEKNKIRLLQGDLRGLIDNYLLEPSEVESPSSTANSWMMEVRDLSYDIDDFIYELTGGSGRDASTSIVQKSPRVNISRFLEKLKRRQWVADEISEFRIRVKEAIRQHKVYLSNCKWRPCRSERRLPPSPCSQASFRLVGMQNSIKQLCGWLAFDEQPENRVASIVGTGGVGKTTLAKEVYGMLGGHFECLAFVRTSRKPDTKRLLASILSQVQQHQLAVADPSDVHTLVSKINAHLRYKTYLVVIDDLWALSTWDIFNHALPKGNRCSRILTTTEVDVIAQTCCADNFKCMPEKKEQNSNFMPLKTEDNSKYMPSKKEDMPPKKQVESKYIPLKGKNNPVYMPSMKEDNSRYIIKMRPLREDEARELFLSTAFGQQAECPQCIKEVSNEIIKRSGGFPLAINILARLLAGQTASSLDQWNYIKNSLSSSLTSNSNLEGINHVLNLGYDDLPHGLKACMLYLCLYEEDCVIWKDDLVKQWIAEGFICAEEGDDGEEVAQSYFDELVIRGMIQSVDINCNGEILSCRVHHMVFNFIRYKSIEENFSIAIDYSQNVIRHADKVRRLALHFSNVGDATLPALASMRLSKIRSVAFFGFLKCMPSLVEYRFLQVLHLKLCVDPDKMNDNLTGSGDLSGNINEPNDLSNNLTGPDDPCYNLTEISELFRLKYFHLDACHMRVKLPTQMQRLKDLVAWEIDAEVTAVPSDIVDLRGLFYLRFPSEAHLPSCIGRMTSLRTLGLFDLSKNSTETLMSLGDLTNLQDLRLTCSTLQSDNLEKNLECLGSIIWKLSNIKCVTLVPAISSHVSNQNDAGASNMSTSWHGFTIAPLPPALLQTLELSRRCCIFSNLPKWIKELTKLRILKIALRKVSTEDVVILKGLPSLTALSLFIWTVPIGSIIFDNEGFSVLKYFKFVCGAPRLAFLDGAMPNVLKLKQGFNANRMERYRLDAAGFNRLLSLNEISIKIGGAGTDEHARRSAQSVLTESISNHPGSPIINVKCVDWNFSDDDKKYIEAQKEICNQTSEKQDEHGIQEMDWEEDTKKQAHIRPTYMPRQSTLHLPNAGALVSASTGAMGSLPGKLGAMLTDEYKMLKNVRRDIKFLKDELEVMNAFLLKMSDVEDADELTKLRVTAVREMSYKIEDNIDQFMVLVVDRESGSSKADGIRKLIDKCKSLLPEIKTRRKIAEELKDIKNQLKEVNDRFLRYKTDESSSMPAKDKVVGIDGPSYRDAVYRDATELVGIDGPRDELVKWLNEKEGESLRSVSIVGYGGLGKTTLATQIRANLGAGATFECGAFVSISRKPDMKAILRSILSQITKQDNVYSGLDDIKLLMDKIREFLQDRRYFIIIDDIWEPGTWETLKYAFVKNTCGSRIMITTRIVDVAKFCSPSNKDLVYEMKPLSEADSKKLFFKRIFGWEESCPDKLKEASKDILKKCHGLPLAINVISSLLATTTETKEEWDRVRHSIRSSKAKRDIIETMNYILSLSYFDLPHHLRSCILYLALFPEDELIERKRLVRRWISEGFIHGENGQDLMELGEEYFHELVNRSLIMPEEIGYDGKVGNCRVHDTILDFLIAKSSEENLCTVLKKQCKPDGIVRRISLMGTEDEEILEQLDLSHARSIGAFGDIKRLPPLGKSKSLRVLDVQCCYKLENHHIKDIERLYQLRYLDISFTEITELPKQIGELQYLETLITSTNLCELPESTTRLRRLVRLFVSPDCKLPDGLGNLVNLQELELIDALNLKHVEELGKLTNLRKLKISLRTEWIEGNKLVQSKEKLVSALCKLNKCGLCSLSIDYYLGEKDGEGPFLPALGCIHEVCVYGDAIFWIIRWLSSLPNLQKLYFVHPRKIEQQDIEMIGLIPNLLELSLYFGMYDTQRLIIRCKGFQQLQSFAVFHARMGDLMFEPGAMPRLKELKLHYFKEKPKSDAGDFDFGIQYLSSLAHLSVKLYCWSSTAAEVKAAEDAFKSMAQANPNRPTLMMTRQYPHCVLQDKQIDIAGSGTTQEKEESA